MMCGWWVVVDEMSSSSILLLLLMSLLYLLGLVLLGVVVVGPRGDGAILFLDDEDAPGFGANTARVRRCNGFIRTGMCEFVKGMQFVGVFVYNRMAWFGDLVLFLRFFLCFKELWA